MNEKILELVVGQEFRSYRELCTFLGEKIKSGSSKIAQMKQWSKYFTIKKEGNKITILENLAVVNIYLDWEVGKEFKNYGDIRKALREGAKAGNSKTSQLKNWENFFSWKQEGHKYIITEIHDRNFSTKNAFDNRKKMPNSRLKDMEKVLLHLLSVPQNLQEFGKMIISKSQLNKVMGIVNQSYYSMYRELTTKDTEHVSSTEGAKIYYQKTKKMFERDMNSVFDSLVNKKLINYTQVIMGTPTEIGEDTVANYNNGMVLSLVDGKRVELPLRELSDDEVTLLQKIEYAALVKMGMKNVGQVHAQDKFHQFKRAVDEEFSKKTGLIKVYRAYKILYSKEVLEHYALHNKKEYQLDETILNNLRNMINQSYQKSICQNAKLAHDRTTKNNKWEELPKNYIDSYFLMEHNDKKIKVDYMFSKSAYYFSLDSVKDTDSLTDLLIDLKF